MSIIINRIKIQTDYEENSFQCMGIGRTGSGKSFSMLTFCEKLDPGFNINRVVFTPEEFLRLINSDIPAGSAILCDEIGSWLSSRDWYSLQNKLMSMVLETYRFKRLVVFWTVPNIRMVDVNLRDLCHATIETIKIDRKKNKCECKFKYRQVNPMTGKSYDKFPVIRNKKGYPVTLTRILIKRPSPQLEDQYLRKKKMHLNQMYKDIEKQIQRMHFKPKKKKITKKHFIIKDLKKGLSPIIIAKKRKTTPGYVRELRKQLFS